MNSPKREVSPAGTIHFVRGEQDEYQASKGRKVKTAEAYCGRKFSLEDKHPVRGGRCRTCVKAEAVAF